MRRFLATIALSALAGCDSPTGPADLTGTWEGTNSVVTVTLHLTESSGSVTGTGSIVSLGNSYPVTVTGTLSGSALSLDATVTGAGSATYSGTVRGSRIDGELNGAGFDHYEFDLTKQ